MIKAFDLDLYNAIENAKKFGVDFSEITINDKYTAYDSNIPQAFIGFAKEFPDKKELTELRIVCKL